MFYDGDVSRLRKYLMTYMQELERSRPTNVFFKHMGWQGDGTFVLGKHYAPSGQPVQKEVRFNGIAKDFAPHFTQKGDPALWTKATSMFARPGMELHGFILCMMAGSICYEPSGLRSAVVNMYAGESGSGKTLTGLFGRSLWGNPTQNIIKLGDSPNSVFKRLGVYRNVAPYIDEVTTIEEEEFRRMVFQFPEGIERERLTNSGMSLQTPEKWFTPVFMSSNRNLYDLLTIRGTSEAEVKRVLQFSLPRNAFFEEGRNGRLIERILQNNYGFAGPLLIQQVLDSGGAAVLLEQAIEDLRTKFQFRFAGQERFYEALCAITWVGGQLLQRTGLINFSPEASMDAGLENVDRIRKEHAASTPDGLDLLAQFLTENVNNMVHLYINEDKNGHVRQDVQAPQHRAGIIRTEVHRDKDRRLKAGVTYINTVAFKRWCRENGVEFSEMKRQWASQGVIFKEGVRKSLYKGVEGSGGVGQTTCVELQMCSHPRLIEGYELLPPPGTNMMSRMVSIR